jgi:hypothetical protein
MRGLHAVQLREHDDDDHLLQTYGVGKSAAVVSHTFQSPHE